ncbi:hypothetical protein [Amaricoccus tamworthensis]|uniref:hypothetical protein n=1 Tax=Amaricoccus tamworthensis TaxID=57002 RepID=UPI003C7D67A9
MPRSIPTWTNRFSSSTVGERTSRATLLLRFLFGQILILCANPHLTWAVAWCSSIWLPWPGHPRLTGLNTAFSNLNRILG